MEDNYFILNFLRQPETLDSFRIELYCITPDCDRRVGAIDDIREVISAQEYLDLSQKPVCMECFRLKTTEYGDKLNNIIEKLK